MEGGDGRFLAAMLGAGTREHAANLADQHPLDPEAAGLVKEVTHLRAHVTEACGRSKDDGIVVGKLVCGRDGRGLVQLHGRSVGNLLRYQFGHTLNADFGTRHPASTFGHRPSSRRGHRRYSRAQEPWTSTHLL